MRWKQKWHGTYQQKHKMEKFWKHVELTLQLPIHDRASTITSMQPQSLKNKKWHSGKEQPIDLIRSRRLFHTFVTQFRSSAENLLVRDDVPRVTQHTAVCNTMQLKLRIACQKLGKEGGGLFSGAHHIVMQRKISTLKELAEMAQYCIDKDSSSVHIYRKNHQTIRDVKHEILPKQLIRSENKFNS